MNIEKIIEEKNLVFHLINVHETLEGFTTPEEMGFDSFLALLDFQEVGDGIEIWSDKGRLHQINFCQKEEKEKLSKNEQVIKKEDFSNILENLSQPREKKINYGEFLTILI